MMQGSSACTLFFKINVLFVFHYFKSLLGEPLSDDIQPVLKEIIDMKTIG
jgi:hypothetical protein